MCLIGLIAARMLAWAQVETSGDTELLPGQLVDQRRLRALNEASLAQGGEPAHAHQVVLGISAVGRANEGFLAAAAFRDTAAVLAEAALAGRRDDLRGPKQRIMVGGLIPAGTGAGEGGEPLAAAVAERAGGPAVRAIGRHARLLAT
jgi:DNA-directed RNA polymerase subunit beta'